MLRMLLVCSVAIQSSVLRYAFLILDTYRPSAFIYVSKDVRIRGYFSKPNPVRKQVWETNGISGAHNHE
jgi:hypothetical protein